MTTGAEADELGRRYAPVLQEMVEMLGAEGDNKLTFGQALEQAQAKTGIVVPEDMHAHLLTSAFQIISSGRIPGLPDA